MNSVAHQLSCFHHRVTRFTHHLHPCLYPFGNLLARVDLRAKSAGRLV